MCCTFGMSGYGSGGGLYATISSSDGVSNSSIPLTNVTAANNTAGRMHFYVVWENTEGC
jgi:hypothetical protein